MSANNLITELNKSKFMGKTSVYHSWMNKHYAVVNTFAGLKVKNLRSDTSASHTHFDM